MGIFRSQIPRLLRTKWPNANLLAQELVAIFSSDTPIEIDSPLQITQDPNGNPPIDFTMRPIDEDGSFGQPITINVGGGQTVPNPEFPVGTFAPTLVDVGTVPLPPNSPPVPTRPSTGGGGGVGFYGRIVSRSASQTFSIAYIKADGSEETVTAVCENLNTAADLPAGLGVSVFVYENGSNFFIVPVWL